MTSEDPLAAFIEQKYSISLIEDERKVVYRPTCVVVSAQEPVSALFSAAVFDANEERNVMLAVVVLEEYSLCGTDYPVSVQLFHSGSTARELPGTQCTLNKRTWSAVLLPGHQFDVEDKVMFEPPVTHMKLARQLFPNISDAESERGVIKIQSSSMSNWWLCTEETDRGRIICPLGYVLAKSSSQWETQQGAYHAAEHPDKAQRAFIVLPERDAKDQLAKFRVDTQDPRPPVNLTALKVEARALSESAGPFVLSMRIGVFFYNTKKREE